MACDESVLTSSYVIVETTALLHGRFGARAVREFLENLVPAVSVVWVDEALHNTAMAAALATSGKHGPSLVELREFEVIRRRGATKVLAHDKHCARMGYPTVG